MSSERATLWLGPALKNEREIARLRGVAFPSHLEQLVARYRALLRMAAPKFSAAEWDVFWAALNGLTMPGLDDGDIPTAGRLAAELHDWSLGYGDDNPPSVDLSALHRRVLAMTPIEVVAMIEYIEKVLT